MSFPDNGAVVDPRNVPGDDVSLQNLFQQMHPAGALTPSKLHTQFDISSDLFPPNPATHYHVLVYAPGTSGSTLDLGLEALNLAGYPLENLGAGFAPVRALSDTAQVAINQQPRLNCGAPIRALTAYRLSSDPNSIYFNRYLSRPFVVIAERIKLDELATFRTMANQEVLWGGAEMRAFLDPDMSQNLVLGPFAAQVDNDRKIIFPLSQATAYTVNKSYNMGDNPPPISGPAALPGTDGKIVAHSGEFRTESVDMQLPSPRMPIVIRRSIGNQDSYEGPFGVGWDFNYGQRLTILDPLSFPLGLQLPLVVRDTKQDSEIAGSRDILFHSGEGRTIHFRWIDTNMPPEYVQDPLVATFDYKDLASDYYLPEKGVFDLMIRYKDGRFERLTPAGIRYRYDSFGRLETVLDIYPSNRHDLKYDTQNHLIKIKDGSVSDDRFIEFGYYRRQAGDKEFVAGLDMDTQLPYVEGKICRLRDNGGADVLFSYDENGLLTNRLDKTVAGENGGFSGRSGVNYFYDGCLITGMSLTSQAQPQFQGSFALNDNGKPVVQQGQGLEGKVMTSVNMNNTAATVGGSSSSSTLSDGLKVTSTFDKVGNTSTITAAGSGGTQAQVTTIFDEFGLVEKTTYPLQNSQTMVYDTNNSVFRSRANLLQLTVDPGPRGGKGYTCTFSYDRRYNLPSGTQVDANNDNIVQTLTSDGRAIASTQYGTAGTATFTYNDHGQLTSHTDLRGVVQTYDYNPANGYVTAEHHGDNVYTYTYGSDYASLMGRPSSTAPPLGDPTFLAYNGRLQIVQKSRGPMVEKYAYDEQERPYRDIITLEDGRTLDRTMSYDERGFITNGIMNGLEVDGKVTPVQYFYGRDDLGRLTQITTPGGTVQHFYYNAFGYVTNMTLGDYSEIYGVDLDGNILSVNQGGDLVLTRQYDGMDRLSTLTRKTGTGQDDVNTMTYYAGGQMQSYTVTDPTLGVVQNETVDTIDALGRPVHMTIHGTRLSPVLTHQYAALSESLIGPALTTSTTWNTAGDDTGHANAIYNSVITPDANGRTMQVDRHEDGITYSQFYTYDDLDHVQTMADLVGPRATYTTRSDGALLTLVNARGNTTSMDHSALQELLMQRRSDGMERDYRFSAERQLDYAGDPGAGFAYQFDKDLRLSQRTLRSSSAITTYTSYDPRGQPKAATLPGGGTLVLGYDLQKRLTNQVVSYLNTTRQENFGYDALDRVRQVSYQADQGPLNQIALTYDNAGPLLGVSLQEEGTQMSVGYDYGADGFRTSVTYASGVKVLEERDATGRLLAITDSNGDIARVTQWKGLSQPAITQLGGVLEVANLYDARGQLRTRRVRRLSDGAIVAHLRTGQDPDDDVTVRQFIHRAGQADVFDYDVADRLSQFRAGALPGGSGTFNLPLYKRQYTYHATGLDYLTAAGIDSPALAPAFATNWSAHDDFLLPGSVDGQARTADPMGNVSGAQLLVRPPGSAAPVSVAATLEHDGLGHLVKVSRSDGVVVANVFEPGGQRIARRVTQNGVLTASSYFVYDSTMRLLEEFDLMGAQPALRARYYYLSGFEPVAADLLVGGALQRVYYIHDDVGSVIALTDDKGQVLERTWYDAFGQAVIEAPDKTPPTIGLVQGSAGGSLLIGMSERVFAPLADPGLAVGILPVSASPPISVQMVDKATQAAIAGTVSADSLPGFPPGAVVRFTPSQSITGAVSLTLSAGTVADDWGNLNSNQVIALNVSNTVVAGTFYFGSATVTSTAAPRLARSSVGSPFLFQGEYLDYDTGLLYLRARYYDSYSGMFLEPDPAGYEDSVNLYAGFGQNPASKTDPSGLINIRLGAEEFRALGRGIMSLEKAAGREEGAVFRIAKLVEHNPLVLGRPGANRFFREGLQQHWGSLSQELERLHPGFLQPGTDVVRFDGRGRHLAEGEACRGTRQRQSTAAGKAKTRRGAHRRAAGCKTARVRERRSLFPPLRAAEETVPDFMKFGGNHAESAETEAGLNLGLDFGPAVADSPEPHPAKGRTHSAEIEARRTAGPRTGCQGQAGPASSGGCAVEPLPDFGQLAGEEPAADAGLGLGLDLDLNLGVDASPAPGPAAAQARRRQSRRPLRNPPRRRRKRRGRTNWSSAAQPRRCSWHSWAAGCLPAAPSAARRRTPPCDESRVQGVDRSRVAYRGAEARYGRLADAEILESRENHEGRRSGNRRRSGDRGQDARWRLDHQPDLKSAMQRAIGSGSLSSITASRGRLSGERRDDSRGRPRASHDGCEGRATCPGSGNQRLDPLSDHAV